MAHAYAKYGDAKFEELSVMFATRAVEVVTLSCNEDTPAPNIVDKGKGKNWRGKATLIPDVGPSNHAPMMAFDKHDMDRYWITMARPPYPITAYVPPKHPVSNSPKFTPLHLVDVSNNLVETPPFNIWDYIEYFSDTELGATDISTANSYNYRARGQRSNLDRKKKSSGGPKKCRTSATDSCSPFPTEKR